MSRPPAHATVLFELTVLTRAGQVKRVFSGYRPLYAITTDICTSATHEFLDVPHVETGDRVRAHVWFLVPENYPGSLWVGRTLKVAEGARDVGVATVLAVHHPLLARDGVA
jgi:translation elongation factor EF-Tu-like GTPase